MDNIKKAFEILNKTMNEQAYANLLMKSLSTDYNIAYITQLVYGTLRNYKRSREGWKHFVKGDLSDEISTLLDLGVYMLSDIKNTPSYATVNSIVEISKDIQYGKYTKLTNAVLKRYIKEGQRSYDESSLEDLSIKYSHPLWLVKMWKSHYGIDTTIKLLKYNNTESNVTLRVNLNKISVEKLLSLDSKFKKGSLAPEEVYYNGNIFETEYFRKGYVSIQDAASQLVAHAINPQVKDKILDTCSAPGTKSIHMASLRNDQGVIDAVELYDSRASLIQDEMYRLNIQSINVYTHDARYLNEILDEYTYDKVLVDAPCTGFGVMRGKPEIKISAKGEDIDSITKVQKEILESASQMLKDGGTLVYSTCTLNKKENESQIKDFLENHKEFKLVQEKTIFGYEHMSDSFYMAILQKLK